MCIRVQLADTADLDLWDPARRLVSLPSGLTRHASLNVLRAILSELAVPQPAVGARCFCGASVSAVPRVPQQRRSEQVSHGA